MMPLTLNSWVDPDEAIDESLWLVSVINTAGIMDAHAALVVEGVLKSGKPGFFKPQRFIEQYDIRGVMTDKELQDFNKDNAEETCQRLCKQTITQLSNGTGYITKIGVRPQQRCTAQYYEHIGSAYKRTYVATQQQAWAMVLHFRHTARQLATVMNEHNTHPTAKKGLARVLELVQANQTDQLMRYQRYGSQHPFGKTNGGTNCTQYLYEVMVQHEVIQDQQTKVKPPKPCVIL